MHGHTSETNDGHIEHMRAIDLAARIHRGVGGRIYEDLLRFRPRLTPELVTTFESARTEVENVGTIEEARNILHALFEKVHQEAIALPLGNVQRDELLKICIELAELFEGDKGKKLKELIDKTSLPY